MKAEKILVRIAAILYAIYTAFLFIVAFDFYVVFNFGTVLFIIFGCTMTVLFVLSS